MAKLSCRGVRATNDGKPCGELAYRETLSSDCEKIGEKVQHMSINSDTTAATITTMII